MAIASTSSSRDIVRQYLDQAWRPAHLSADEAQALRQRIVALLAREQAVMVAHYYTDPSLQALAEETGGFVGDSLEMARFGNRHPAQTLVVCGVRFMGETAKILSPDKRVLMPTLEATCSLDIGCPIEAFSAFCDAHPERTVVVYANTSAAVKARADWVVTSSIALAVAEHLMDEGKAILWGPDKHLGDYIQRCTGADMLMWDGSCIVHEEFKAKGLLNMKAVHPEAAILAHPESPSSVLDIADFIGSTSQIIHAAKTRPERQFIVATDQGIFYKLQQTVPDKEFIIAPTAGEGATCRSCANCPWMGMNSLENLAETLEHGRSEIHVDRALARRALIPLERMLAFPKP